jgi:hypothetical protein
MKELRARLLSTTSHDAVCAGWWFAAKYCRHDWDQNETHPTD